MKENTKTINLCGIKIPVKDKRAELMQVLQSVRDDIINAISLQTKKIDSVERLIKNTEDVLTTSIKSFAQQISNDIDNAKSDVIKNIKTNVDEIIRINQENGDVLKDKCEYLNNNLISSIENNAENINKNLIDFISDIIGKSINNITDLNNGLIKELKDNNIKLNDILLINLKEKTSNISNQLDSLKSGQVDLKNLTINNLSEQTKVLTNDIHVISDRMQETLKNLSELSEKVSLLDTRFNVNLSNNQKFLVDSINSSFGNLKETLKDNSKVEAAFHDLNEKLEKVLNSKYAQVANSINLVSDLVSKVLKDIDEVTNSLSSFTMNLKDDIKNTNDGIYNISKYADTAITKIKADIDERLNTLPAEIVEKNQYIAKLNSEPYWANVYHDTIINSSWLKDKTVSPGRWAVSYIVLYVLYRVLNEARPKNILECGLGQSSKLTIQYAQSNNANLMICENNPEWVKFFEKNFTGAEKYVKLLDIEMKEVVSPYKSRTYAGFSELIKDNKFDLVIVDGPLGSERYSRPEILDIVDNLAPSFIIMLDDLNRAGEQDIWELLKDSLDAKGIKYVEAIYSSDKSLGVICSPDLQFLTSL